MRISMPSIMPTVEHEPGAARRVVLRLRSLRISMTAAEAIELSNLLIDTVEDHDTKENQ